MSGNTRKNDAKSGPKQSALATVTSDNFAPGTLVLLHSFLKHHPEFDGSLVVIHDELSDAWARRIVSLAAGRNVQWVTPSAELQARVEQIFSGPQNESSRGAALRAWRRRFCSLEVARLTGFDRVVFFDSDILVRGDLSAVFETDAPVLVTGDGAWYHGCGRHRRTFQFVPLDAAAEATSDPVSDVVTPTFNAGMISLRGDVRGVDTYESLLRLLDPDAWRMMEKPLTDQRIWNLHFNGDVDLAPATHNYLLAHRDSIRNSTGIGINDAVAVHYNHPHKPWQSAHLPDAVRADPATLPAWRWWTEAWFDVVQNLHLLERITTSTIKNR